MNQWAPVDRLDQVVQQHRAVLVPPLDRLVRLVRAVQLGQQYPWIRHYLPDPVDQFALVGQQVRMYQ